MAELTLYIGNKNYSSWSLRGWLLLKHVGTPFKEVVIPLNSPAPSPAIREYSPSGKIPALRYGELAVWDSLAIAEYLAEEFHQAHLWPVDRTKRGPWLDRSAPRCTRASHEPPRADADEHPPHTVRSSRHGSPEVELEIARIVEIWADCRRRFQSAGALSLRPLLRRGRHVRARRHALSNVRRAAGRGDPRVRDDDLRGAPGHARVGRSVARSSRGSSTCTTSSDDEARSTSRGGDSPPAIREALSFPRAHVSLAPIHFGPSAGGVHALIFASNAAGIGRREQERGAGPRGTNPSRMMCSTTRGEAGPKNPSAFTRPTGF